MNIKALFETTYGGARRSSTLARRHAVIGLTLFAGLVLGAAPAAQAYTGGQGNCTPEVDAELSSLVENASSYYESSGATGWQVFASRQG
ncbi:MAG: hypothetical protein ACRER2_06465, partial [Methylococcales bacterium]